MQGQGKSFNVKEYGALGDGSVLDTSAIQAAIDSCSASQGGTVYFPNGKYLAGTLYMRSNVALYLEVSAVLLGSPDINDYATDTHKQRYDRESHMDRCLIFSEEVENITFCGPGVIDGQGKCFPNSGTKDRPMMMRFLKCRNVRLKDIRLHNPASWTTAFILCDTVFADTLNIFSNANHNGDGLDFDSCRNVLVSNCMFDTSDDSICLQNSEKNHSCRNIVVQNCIMKSKWAAIRIGLLSSGDFEDVTVSNCIFQDISCSGIKIQSAEGGYIRNMLFENIVMRNVTRPIFITFNHFHMGVDAPSDPPETGGISNLQFNNIRVDTDAALGFVPNTGIVMIGTPGNRIENISINNFEYTLNGGGKRNDELKVPEMLGCRPEYFTFDGRLPSYGAYMRHVSGLSFQNLRFILRKPDGRFAIACDKVENFELDNWMVEAFSEAEGLVLLEGSSKVYINRVRVKGQGAALVHVKNDTEDVVLMNNNLMCCK